jgi:bacteriocin leader peptide (microcyclamide/patellamide family)
MNHKSITPNPQQPVDRVPAGQLPSALAELSEATLADSMNLLPQQFNRFTFELMGVCSFDGDDE